MRRGRGAEAAQVGGGHRSPLTRPLPTELGSVEGELLPEALLLVVGGEDERRRGHAQQAFDVADRVVREPFALGVARGDPEGPLPDLRAAAGAAAGEVDRGDGVVVRQGPRR